MSKLLVYFEVETDEFGLVMGSIGPTMAVVQNLRVETLQQKPVRTRRAPVINHIPLTTPVDQPAETERLFVNRSDVIGPNGERIRVHKNSKIENLILESLGKDPGHPFDYDYLYDAAEARGFSRKSISPAVSNLVRRGVINRKDRRVWVD